MLHKFAKYYKLWIKHKMPSKYFLKTKIKGFLFVNYILFVFRLRKKICQNLVDSTGSMLLQIISLWVEISIDAQVTEGKNDFAFVKMNL